MADDKGFTRKLNGLLELGKAMSALPLDAASFAQDKLSSEMLNLPREAVHPESASKGSGIIRRITGMLVRSITLAKGVDGSSIRLYMNEGTAPYAQKVDDYSRRRYGMGYLELFLAFYSAEIQKKMRNEIAQGIRDIDAGKAYKYYNPFVV